MIRKRPELDTVNPPGQIVNPIPASKLYKSPHGGYTGEIPQVYDTEEMFAPTSPDMSQHSRVRRLLDRKGK